MGNLHDCISSTNWSRKHSSLTTRSQKSTILICALRLMLTLFDLCCKITKTTVIWCAKTSSPLSRLLQSATLQNTLCYLYNTPRYQKLSLLVFIWHKDKQSAFKIRWQAIEQCPVSLQMCFHTASAMNDYCECQLIIAYTNN